MGCCLDAHSDPRIITAPAHSGNRPCLAQDAHSESECDLSDSDHHDRAMLEVRGTAVLTLGSAADVCPGEAPMDCGELRDQSQWGARGQGRHCSRGAGGQGGHCSRDWRSTAVPQGSHGLARGGGRQRSSTFGVRLWCQAVAAVLLFHAATWLPRGAAQEQASARGEQGSGGGAELAKALQSSINSLERAEANTTGLSSSSSSPGSTGRDRDSNRPRLLLSLRLAQAQEQVLELALEQEMELRRMGARERNHLKATGQPGQGTQASNQGVLGSSSQALKGNAADTSAGTSTGTSTATSAATSAASSAAPPPVANTPQLQPPHEMLPICKKTGYPVVVLSSANIAPFRWKGWGTTLAWFANYVGGLPSDQFNALMDLLFDPVKGLGFNIARYNIGGGHNATLSPQFNFPNAGFWNALPSFKASAKAKYDWTADERQRRCLLAAKARGANRFLAISFSPPWWATVTGDVSGSADGLKTNLRASRYDSFGRYLAKVVHRYSEAWGVNFEALEPVNEPTNTWRAGSLQEACPFSVTDLARLYPRVARQLKKYSPSTALGGFNDWVLASYRQFKSRVLHGPALDSIPRLHVHGYYTPWGPGEAPPGWASESAFSSIRQEAVREDKEVWMTEWSFLSHSGPDLDLGLMLARNIIETVNYMGASAYVFWQAIDKTERFSLINIRWDPYMKSSYPHRLLKKFWVFKHFTRFAPRGSLPLSPVSTTTCERCVASFYNADDASLALFVVNQQATPARMTFVIKGFKVRYQSKKTPLMVYRTSLEENFAKVNTLPWTLGTNLTCWVRGRSLTTLVFRNIRRIV